MRIPLFADVGEREKAADVPGVTVADVADDQGVLVEGDRYVVRVCGCQGEEVDHLGT
jgi:hypothetical protein